MSKEQMRIAIAESRGWTDIYHMMDGTIEGIKSDKTYGFIEPVPDYTGDLNACHEFENDMSIPKLAKYRDNLACMLTDHPDDGMRYTFHATARQRAEAYLRTIGLWKEGE